MDPVRNFAKVTLMYGYISSDTEIQLVTGHGDKLPDPAVEGTFDVSWYNSSDYDDPADDPNAEIVTILTRTDDICTIDRAQQDTVARDHNDTGKTYKMVLTLNKKNYDQLKNGLVHESDEKLIPADNDELGLIDSAASYVFKKLSFLNLKKSIGSYLNPIGTIREFNVATNPAILLGFGNWSLHGVGRVTVCIDESDADFNAVDEIGGAKTKNLQHIHAYSGTTAASNQFTDITPGSPNIGFAPRTHAHTYSGNTENGGSATQDVMNPYITVYRWVRTN